MVNATTAAASLPQIKRKQSAAGISSGGRNVKRRASKACHCCRSRKVRCDVVESGIPCTNCRLDEVECLVTEGKRRRKSYIEGDLLNQSPPAFGDEDQETTIFPIFDDINGLPDLDVSLDGMSQGVNMASLEDGMHQYRPHMICKHVLLKFHDTKNLQATDQTQGHKMSQEERTRRMSAISIKPLLHSPAAIQQLHQYFPLPTKQADIVLPKYIRPVSQSVMREDLDYLQQRGAFMVPETSLRNELLRCYVQYVHPFLPILELQDFLTSIEKNESNDTLSLLLFQAVMFAGSGFIDMRYLLAQGYDSRKAARRSFFQRAKVLYDFDYEVNRLTVVQAVLLMTYYYEAPDDPKDVWHWLGIAISLARTIGINCDTSESSMDLKTRKLWKRIWWGCYTRDRLVSLGMRRPMRINESDFDMPMLELADFETNAMPLELSKMLGGCPSVKDASKRITLSNMCIALTKLCQCVTEVLGIQYSLMAAKLGPVHETTVRLVPKKSAADPSDVIRCDRKLEDWYNSQDDELHYFVPGTAHERTNSNDGEVISVHRGLLSGVYLTALSALHRPQIMPAVPTLVIAPELQELSRRKVHEAADEITEIYKDLYACDMIRYLPNTGVSVILPALIIHMLDLKSNDPSIRQAAARKFQFCMQALQRLREMYASADFAFSFLDAAVRKVEVQVPGTLPASAVNDRTKRNQATQQSPVMLTPPPEAAWTAERMLFAATLAPEEKRLIAALTPPKSDHSLQSVMTGGAAIALTDLPYSPGDGSDHHSIEEQEARELERQAQNDFDSLINLEADNELLNTTSDKGIYAEMNMAWLNGMNDDDDDGYDDAHGKSKSDPSALFEDKLENSGYEERSKAEPTSDLDSDLDIIA